MKKPSDLIIPFSFEKRRPIIIERFFFIPTFYDKHGEWGGLDLAAKEIFSEYQMVNIEYCSGNGQWILDKAQKSPHLNWIAVEFRFERARKIWIKAHNLGLKNILVVFGEAFCFSKHYLKKDTISNIFINFPDPWPKKRHEKHRLVTPEFMKELSRIVVEGGIATLVTDDSPTQELMVAAALSSERWKALFKHPHFTDHLEDYGSSYFDSLWKSKGKKIKYLQFSNSK
jgi:tRNA (guanine-N7-)-methyltransferase